MSGYSKIEYLTVLEAAELLKVKPGWIYERTRKREIPVRKLGRHCRIPRAELMAWVERNGKMEGDR
jgi:excisionase family DNA binding protein